MSGLSPGRAVCLLAAAAFGLGACGADSGAPDASAAEDRLEVMELMHRYALGVDGLDRELLARTFASDAVAEYVVVGEAPYELDEHLEGFDAIYGWLHGVLQARGDTVPGHFMTNHIVDLDGDRARLTVYMHNRYMTGGGVYTIDAVRTPEGWRITRLHLEERAFSRPSTAHPG